jgi:hypothetical protein
VERKETRTVLLQNAEDVVVDVVAGRLLGSEEEGLSKVLARATLLQFASKDDDDT